MKSIFILLITILLTGCASISNIGKAPKSPDNASENKSQETRTVKQTASDLRISTGIHADLLALDLFKPVKVTVNNGVVTYTGTVPTNKDNFVVLGVAWKQNGVKEVINNLKVAK